MGGCVCPARKSVDAYLPLLNQFHVCPLWTLNMTSAHISLTVTEAQPLLDGSGLSAASPGESGHVVSFLLCGFDEAQKLEF